MCGGAPDIPQTPERQDARAPARSATGAQQDDPMRRRRGYAAMMSAASAGGAMSPVSTTATAAKTNLGA
jgi:hypothetical protein